MSSQRRDYDRDLPREGTAAPRGADRDSESYQASLNQSLRRLWWAAGIAWLVAICVLYLTYCHKPPREPNIQAQAPKPAASAQSTTGQSGATGQSTTDLPMSNGYRVGPDGKLLQPDQGNLTPPQLPEEAKQETPEGAEAFAKHYVALLTYAIRTGDTDELKGSYNEECKSCKERTEIIESQYMNGGWVDGEGHLVEQSYRGVQLNNEDREKNLWRVILHVHTPAHTQYYEDGVLEPIEPFTTEMLVKTCWQNNTWIVCGTIAQEKK